MDVLLVIVLIIVLIPGDEKWIMHRGVYGVAWCVLLSCPLNASTRLCSLSQLAFEHESLEFICHTASWIFGVLLFSDQKRAGDLRAHEDSLDNVVSRDCVRARERCVSVSGGETNSLPFFLFFLSPCPRGLIGWNGKLHGCVFIRYGEECDAIVGRWFVHPS